MTNVEHLRRICAALGLDHAEYAAAYDRIWTESDRIRNQKGGFNVWGFVYYRLGADGIPLGRAFWEDVALRMRSVDLNSLDVLKREYRKAKVRRL
jgi:hypothetical protein